MLSVLDGADPLAKRLWVIVHPHLGDDLRETAPWLASRAHDLRVAIVARVVGWLQPLPIRHSKTKFKEDSWRMTRVRDTVHERLMYVVVAGVLVGE